MSLQLCFKNMYYHFIHLFTFQISYNYAQLGVPISDARHGDSSIMHGSTAALKSLVVNIYLNPPTLTLGILNNFFLFVGLSWNWNTTSGLVVFNDNERVDSCSWISDIIFRTLGSSIRKAEVTCKQVEGCCNFTFNPFAHY